MPCPTVKIKVEPTEGNPSGVVLINECDFDPAKHTAYEAPAAAPVAKEEVPSSRKRRGEV